MQYLYLFLSAFIAATLFPLSSEALLTALLYQHYSPLTLWLVATIGNTLGSCVNWYLGKSCLHLQDRSWFPVKPAQLAKYQVGFQKYGILSLLFAWLPIVGDPLTLVAGVMRVRFLTFLPLVALGKAARYAAVIYIAQRLIN